MNNIESPRIDDAGVEPLLAAQARAPRVTKEDLERNIVSAKILKHVSDSGQILRWAVLETRNGFAVTGRPSAAVCPENDIPELGERLAIENARNELWTLMGYELKERMRVDVEAIARVCHEVNRAYCLALGDTSQPAWEDAPEWQRSSAMAGVKLHLENPDAGPQASHESWMRQKVAEGWVYGPVKDPEKKQHHCMVPFDMLPREQQAKDYIFRGVVHAMSGRP